MRIVCFDTATRIGAVALLEAAGQAPVRIVRDFVADATDTHAERILPVLEQLLADAGWPKSSLDAYAATRGPGSFTGLRVGLGTVRGLALAAERPALGIGTLDAMAEAVEHPKREIIPLLDAGRGEVYGACFDASTHPPRELVAPWVGPVERAVDPSRPEAAVVGAAAAEYLDRLRAAGLRGSLAAARISVAAAAGRIAATRLGAGARDGEGLEPLYIRPAAAKIGSAGRPPG